MSQKAVFVKVEGNLYEEVLTNVPDDEEMIQICKDMGFEASDGDTYFSELEVEYEWIEIYPKGIGAGESDSDCFLDDDKLLHLFDSDDYEKSFADAGYDVDFIEAGAESIYFEELEED